MTTDSLGSVAILESAGRRGPNPLKIVAQTGRIAAPLLTNCLGTGLRKALTGVLLVASALASGCANNYLYSSTRDKQGATAQTTWKAVDLKPLFAQERANQVKLLKEEKDNQDALSTTARDLRIRIIASEEPLMKSLVEPLSAALSEAIGSSTSTPELTSWLGLRSNAKTAANQNEMVNGPELGRVGIEAPACAELADGKTPKYITDARTSISGNDGNFVDIALQSYRNACASQKTFEAVPFETVFKMGRVQSAWKTHDRDSKTLEKMKADSTEAQKNYKSAKQAYADATEEAKDRTSEQKRVQNAKDDLISAIKNLDQLPDPISRLFINEEKVAVLQEYVGNLTYSPDKSVTKGAGQIAAAAVLFPKIIDDTSFALAAAKKPIQTPLIIARNGFELKANAAAKDLAAQEAVVRLSQDIFGAEVARMDALLAADTELHDPEKVPSKALTLPLIEAEKKYPHAAEKIEVAVLRYLDAIGVLEARKLKLEYARWDAFSERKVAYSEDAAAQWQSIINITVAQQAAYHSDGWTTEKILAPINSALLFVIGLRVTR